MKCRGSAVMDMPPTISGRIFVKGKSALGPQKEGKNEEENSAKIYLHEVKTTDEIPKSDQEKHVGNSQPNFPDLTLTSQGGKGNQDQSVLPALLRIRSLNFSPQLLHVWNKPNRNLPPSSRSSRSSRTTTEQDEKGAFRNKCEQTNEKVSLEHKNNILPHLLVSTVLDGQRVTKQSPQSSKSRAEESEQDNRGTRAKKVQFSVEDSSIKTKNNTLPLLSLPTTLQGKCLLSQRKQGLNEQQYEKKIASDIKPSELNEYEKGKTSTPNGKHQTTINMTSTKTGKQVTRTVFYLPKADKYYITPDGEYTSSKVCRAIKVEDLKAALIRSDRKDSWVPSVDEQLMKCSVFKAIMQQPTVFLRQPSPIKGLKMPLLDQEASLAAAIQAVKETNEPTSPVPDVTKLTKQLKHFVIKLPPIC